MKKIVLSLILLLSVSLAGFAQRGYGKNACCCLSDSLSKNRPSFCVLTEDQQKEMKEIHDKFISERDAVRKSRITKEMQDQKIDNLIKEKDKAIEGLLTEEQKQLRADRRSDMKSWRGGRKGFRNFEQGRRSENKAVPGWGDGQKNGFVRGDIPYLGKMFFGVDLDTKQKEEFRKITDKHREEMAKLNKKHKEEKERIVTEHKKELEQILTEEQKKTLEQNKGRIPDKRKPRGGN